MSAQTIMAIASLLASFSSLGMLVLHCRRDRAEFMRLKRQEELR